MANTKISAMTAATLPLTGAELVPLVQSGGNVQTPISNLLGAAASAPQGRLTLTSGSPVMTSDVTGASTVYYAPYTGAFVPIWDGSATQVTRFTQLSQATTDGTKSPAACIPYACYDLFVWNDAGTIRCTRGPAWSQAQTATATLANPAVFTANAHGFYEGQAVVFTTTGTLTNFVSGTTYFVTGTTLAANTFTLSATLGGAAISTNAGSQSGVHTITQRLTVRGTGAGTSQISRNTDGYYTNTVAITNGPGAGLGTYVGTVRTNSTSTVDWIAMPGLVSGGGATALHVWNMYNRVNCQSVNVDSATNSTYQTALFRVRAGNVNSISSFVCGLPEDTIEYQAYATVSDTSGSVGRNVVTVFNSMTGDTAVGATTGSETGGTQSANVNSFHASSVLGRFTGGGYAATLELGGTNTIFIYSNGFSQYWAPGYLKMRA